MSKVALKTFRQGTANLYLQTSKIYHSAEYNFDLGRHLLFIHCRINSDALSITQDKHTKKQSQKQETLNIIRDLKSRHMDKTNWMLSHRCYHIADFWSQNKSMQKSQTFGIQPFICRLNIYSND